MKRSQPDVGLVARGVSHRYGRKGPPALKSVDISVPKGSTAALIGPNGAGKSTLLRCWLGFERPSTGNLEVDGIDVGRHRTEALRHIGYVGQHGALYRDLTVMDHLVLAATLRGDFDIERSAARLADLGLALDRRPTSLSGGQQAQTALTLALGSSANVLLLDEPLASLDPLARNDFIATVREQAKENGCTTMISSHIVGEMDGFCDWLVVLGDGMVILDSSITEAVAGHAVADGVEAESPGAVGAYRAVDGSWRTLVRDDGRGGRNPTLEDLVMGYLAQARAQANGAT